MLILWLRAALIFLVKLIIPEPTRRTRIDSTAPCPACGSRAGVIETVQAGTKIVVQHNCSTCKCYWYEEPISADVAIRAANAVNPPTKA
jgi:transcription elongation factor Elf1